MPNNHETLSSLFDDIAEAIREKDGTSAAIVADTFPERIAAIDTDPSGDATATAADILSPKTAYAGGIKLTGIMPTMTLPTSAITTGQTGTNIAILDIDSNTRYIQIPVGYNSAAAYYTISAVPNMTLPTSTITSGQSGTNKATINRSNNTRYLQIPAGYNASAAYYTISAVADMTVPSAVSTTSSGSSKLTINTSSSTRYLNLPTGYNGTAYYYTIRPVTHTATAAKIAAGQTVDIGDAGSATRIASITGTFSSDATAAATDILSGKTAYVNGSKITGSLGNATITNNTTLPSGSTSSGTINRGSYIKIGAGYNSADKYYLAQADAHSSYTPSSTYFQTSTSGAVTAAVIEANKYASSTYYVKAMTLPTASSSTSSGTAKATIAPSTSAQYLNIPTGYNTAASYYTISAMPTSTITNNTTLPSGSTSSGTINRGSYIKIGAGYVSADTYYLAQADAHSSYTPSSTYFQTSTTGAVSAAKIEANKYAASDYYVKSATPAFDGGAVTGSVTNITGSNVTLSDTDNGISVTGAASATRGAVLYNGAVAGWVSKADNDTALAAGSATTLTGKTRYITAITVPASKTFSVTTSGTTTVSAGSATAGSLTVNAYNSSGTAENSKAVVTNGKWVSTEVTPGAAQGPFYGRVTVKAASAGTAAQFEVSGASVKTTSSGAGYVAANTTVGTVASMTLPTATITSGQSGTNKLTIGRSTSVRYLQIPVGYNASAAYYTISAVPDASPAFDGGAVSGSVSVTSSVMTLADDDPNGVRLSITGSGSATRAAVLYNGAVEGYVSKADNATALAAGSATALTGATKYITNINVPIGKSLHLTTSDGTSPFDYPYIGIDSVGDFANVEVTNNGGTIYVTNNDGTNNYGFVNISDSSTNTDGGVMYAAHTSTSGNLTAGAYNGSTLESFKEIVVAGKWKQNTVTPSGSAQGPFYGRTTVNAGTMASVTVSGTAMTITGGLVTLA